MAKSNLKSDEEALQVIVEAIKAAGFEPGKDFRLAIDAAATEMYEEAKEKGQEGKYYFWKTDIMKTKEEMVAFWEDLVSKYPIISLEDGVSEEDWEAWKMLTDRLGKKIQLVGDDLFVTNTERLAKGIELGVANLKLKEAACLRKSVSSAQKVSLNAEEAASGCCKREAFILLSNSLQTIKNFFHQFKYRNI